MPVAPRGHASAFYKCDYILLGIGIFQGAVLAVQMIKGDIDQPLHRLIVGAAVNYFRLERLALITS